MGAQNFVCFSSLAPFSLLFSLSGGLSRGNVATGRHGPPKLCVKPQRPTACPHHGPVALLCPSPNGTWITVIFSGKTDIGQFGPGWLQPSRFSRSHERTRAAPLQRARSSPVLAPPPLGVPPALLSLVRSNATRTTEASVTCITGRPGVPRAIQRLPCAQSLSGTSASPSPLHAAHREEFHCLPRVGSLPRATEFLKPLPAQFHRYHSGVAGVSSPKILTIGP